MGIKKQKRKIICILCYLHSTSNWSISPATTYPQLTLQHKIFAKISDVRKVNLATMHTVNIAAVRAFYRWPLEDVGIMIQQFLKEVGEKIWKKRMVILYYLTLTEWWNCLGAVFQNLLYTKPISDLKFSLSATLLSVVRISTRSHYQYI